jgi:hypothetical protein
MYTMILLIYLQQGLDVTLDQARLRGEYRKKPDCEAAAGKLRGPLPIPANYAAAWQDVMCVKIASNTRVNSAAPLDLAKALAEHAPLRCQAEGAWERMAEMCRNPPPEKREPAPGPAAARP